MLKVKDSTAFKAGESRAVNVTIDHDIVQQSKVSHCGVHNFNVFYCPVTRHTAAWHYFVIKTILHQQVEPFLFI